MKTIVAAVLLVASLTTLSAAESSAGTSDCSSEGFAAYGQTWAGIPVMADAILAKPNIDEGSCGYVAPAKPESVEKWYQQRLVETGWHLANREHANELTVLWFQRSEQIFKIILSQTYGATIVLMKRPEPNKTMEPTR